MLKGLKCAAILLSLTFLGAVTAALAARAAVPSDTAKSTSKTKSSVPVMSDPAFARAAAEGSFAEVKLGRLAEEKASSQVVKDFAKRMVTDHTKADDDLKAAASKDKLSISIPTQLDARDQATYDRLSKFSGSRFDRAYARDMVRDHVTDVAAFRHEANDGKDASIKSFASQTLPTLEDHLKDARTMLHDVSPKTAEAPQKQKS
jgi:putative membrane protein